MAVVIANVELTGRASINWHMDPFTAGISFSYQHPYNDGRPHSRTTIRDRTVLRAISISVRCR